MKSINQKLDESRQIRLSALKNDLKHWYVIAWNDEITKEDWRMFIFGVVQTIYNLGRMESEERTSNDLITMNKISESTLKKIEQYAAIYEIEF